MASVDVDQLTRIPVEHDEGCGGKSVAGRVPEQMPVDLRRQRRHVRCHRRQAPHQRLNVGGQQRGRHALAGHVGHHEERAIARQVDDIEVVAAHGTQRLVERVDFVTRDLVYRGWLQGLLNLLCRELLGLELRSCGSVQMRGSRSGCRSRCSRSAESSRRGSHPMAT